MIPIRMKYIQSTGAAFLIGALLAACGSAPTATAEPTSAPVATQPPTQKAQATDAVPLGSDLLETIKTRGTLVVATDKAYPPQSEFDKNVQRAQETRCAGDQLTANQFKGFDIEVATQIARRLGVEACFVTPAWDTLVAGGWNDNWDISVGSVTITADRMKVLYFTQPYYTTPAAVFVHKFNTTYHVISDLSGKRIGACGDCTYDQYLRGTLAMPGSKMEFQIKNPRITNYETDQPAIDDLAAGDGTKLDAIMTALPTGMAAIANGQNIKQLGDPVFFEYLAAAVDKKSSLDPKSFVAAVTAAIQAMHKDGSLKALSLKYYNLDLTSAASYFDVSMLEQK